MKSSRKKAPAIPSQKANATPWVEVVADQVRALRHGIVEIVVHDSRVVQIEQKITVRFDESGAVKSQGTVTTSLG
jgi:hypothetical protein